MQLGGQVPSMKFGSGPWRMLLVPRRVLRDYPNHFRSCHSCSLPPFPPPHKSHKRRQGYGPERCTHTHASRCPGGQAPLDISR
jgi:hypothetical protein